MDKLRLLFEKKGRAIYISHLDLIRTMQRVFQRAELPLSYSEGFNPHAQLAIILPLSVGMSSRCELMEFKLREDVDLKTIPERLNKAFPEGIVAVEAYEYERKGKELKWLNTEGILEYDTADTQKVAEELTKLFSSEIVITKKTKRGIGDFNLSEGIKEINFVAKENLICVKATVSAQNPTVSPMLIADAVRQKLPDFAPDFAKFERIEVFDENMKIFR